MIGYIDVHSHILPGVDDGAKTDVQAAKMIKAAYNQGIRTICATSHFRPGMFKVSVAGQNDAFTKVQELIQGLGIDMEVVPGNELYYTENCTEYLKKGMCKCYGNTRYVLVEFSTSSEFEFIRKGINTLIVEGYIPIIAHVERYNCLVKKMKLIDELIECGAYIQVNAESICDAPFTVKHFVRKLLKEELVHFVGSDSHNNTDRGCCIDKAAAYIEKKYGSGYVEELLIDNPSRMLDDKYI